MVAPEVRSIDRDHAVASWDCLLLQIWRGVATPRAVQGLGDAGRALLAAHPGGACSSLSIIEAKSPPPSEQLRPWLANVYREVGPGMRQRLYVAEGSGFHAAIGSGM